MTLARNPREGMLGRRGLTLLELLVVLAVFAVTLGAAIPRLTAAHQNADSAASALIANLRLCRAQSIATGFHYRVNVTSTSTYAVQRMALSGGSWTVDTNIAARTVTLPATVRLTAGSGSYEFDTRGTRVGATAVASVTLHDPTRSDIVVQVWPSGQVNKG